MPPLFSSLAILADSAPGPAAWNMALDEALLRHASEIDGPPVPVLRVYAWQEPAVSFGCFERYAAVALAHPDRVPVRRWTGGGIVLHGWDFTYSLIVPAGFPLAKMRASQSYAAIHASVAGALAQVGVPALLTASAGAKVSTACFENPVESDVLVRGRKVAGAAQRRTRDGLLHQGSIQIPDLPADFRAAFVGAITTKSAPFPLPGVIRSAAHDLAATKYSTREWLEKY